MRKVVGVLGTGKPGRPRGTRDDYWPDRLMMLLSSIRSIQETRYTVSLRELEKACGVSRQTVAIWLRMAKDMGYVDLHQGQPRALELLPEGRRLVKKYESLRDVKRWREMRAGLRKEYDLRRGNEALSRVSRGR